jgi:hypothetical protein
LKSWFNLEKNKIQIGGKILHWKKENPIEQGLKDAEYGKLKEHSEARKLYEKWL